MGLIRALKTQKHSWQWHGLRSSSFLDSQSLMLLTADHSTGSLFEILPGYVAYVALNNAFGDPVVVWDCHPLTSVFFLSSVNPSALMLSS